MFYLCSCQSRGMDGANVYPAPTLGACQARLGSMCRANCRLGRFLVCPSSVRPPTCQKGKQKYDGMEVSGDKRLTALEDENARLKTLLAEAMLDNGMLKDITSKTSGDARRDEIGCCPRFPQLSAAKLVMIDPAYVRVHQNGASTKTGAPANIVRDVPAAALPENSKLLSTAAERPSWRNPAGRQELSEKRNRPSSTSQDRLGQFSQPVRAQAAFRLLALAIRPAEPL